MPDSSWSCLLLVNTASSVSVVAIHFELHIPGLEAMRAERKKSPPRLAAQSCFESKQM